MNKLTASAVFIVTVSGVYGQGVPAATAEKNNAFQYSFTTGHTAPAGPTKTFYFAESGTVTTFGMEALSGKVVTGKPFVGTEERHSVQVLGDGTRIETSDTDKIYRDEQGRTRVERDGGKFVSIQDPIAGATMELNTVARTVRRSQVRTTFQVRSGPIEFTTADHMKKQAAEAGAIEGGATVSRLSEVAVTGAPDQTPAMADELKKRLMEERAIAGASGGTISVRTESATLSGNATPKVDLGTLMVNGVMAQGSRTTLTIPAGQIGNDRAIRVVGEQWYSNDLQMMVKSSNTDPRFGDTTYQLTGITQVSPDPSLFQAPPDYSPAR